MDPALIQEWHLLPISHTHMQLVCIAIVDRFCIEYYYNGKGPIPSTRRLCKAQYLSSIQSNLPMDGIYLCVFACAGGLCDWIWENSPYGKF